jgi:DNA invertase Pin-like site-specific DNA recombinase
MYTICYARISTNNPEQYVSLNNQINTIAKFIKTNKIKHTINIVESTSISNEISKKIKQLCIKHEKVNVIVTSFDRLSRNVSDLNFIKKHIEKIYVINDKRIYNPRTDWKELINSNVSSMEEIEKIKFRIKQNPNKREKTDDEKLLYAKMRCKNIYSILKDKYDEEFLDDVVQFIRKSQNIYNGDWITIDRLYSLYSNKSLCDQYANINYHTTYHITRNDLYGFIKNIFQNQKLNFSEDDPILKEFINANINYARKNIHQNESESESESESDSEFECDITDVTDNLKKLLSNNELSKKLGKNDINYMSKMLEKLNNK